MDGVPGRSWAEFVGLFAPLLLSTIRYKSLLLQLPLVALIPFYFAVVFGLDVQALAVILAGAVVSSGVWISNALIQDIVYEKEVYRYTEMLIASPVKPLVYLAAHLLFAYTVSLVSTLPIALLYSWLTGRVEAVPWSLLLSLLLSVSLSAASVSLGMKFRNLREVGSLPSLVSLLLVFIPPVYYPASRLPGGVAEASLLLPSAAAAEALRGIVQGYSLVDPLLLLVYLAVLSGASILYAALKLDWRLE